MECVILKNAINQIDDFSNAASRKKTRWEKKNWSFNFFPVLYFAAVNSSPPSLIAPAQKNLDHTPKNVHTFKKSLQMGSDFFFTARIWWQNIKQHKTFFVGTNAFACCVHSWTHPFNSFCRQQRAWTHTHRGGFCVRDIYTYWLFEITFSCYVWVQHKEES